MSVDIVTQFFFELGNYGSWNIVTQIFIRYYLPEDSSIDSNWSYQRLFGKEWYESYTVPYWIKSICQV